MLSEEDSLIRTDEEKVYAVLSHLLKNAKNSQIMD
jgi:hypothetical protein